MKNIVHWCMQKKRWTSHTYKSCAKADTILILGGWHTETKPTRKANPRGWVVTDHSNVILNPAGDQLKYFQKGERLLYNKEDIQFNISHGICLLFDHEGCFLVEPCIGGNTNEKQDLSNVV